MNTVKMNLSKSTKNTHVYVAIDEDAPITTVYVQKHGLPKTAPQSITLTIEHEE